MHIDLVQKDGSPRICVVVPVYNHGMTVGTVVDASSAQFPVIAVDDGSTDITPAVLASRSSITVVTFKQNEGKEAALRAGFAAAMRQRFTHAISIDADGQHPVQALQTFAEACRAHPSAFVIGVRDLRASGAPLLRRASNALSTFCFRLETGRRLQDTQCGLRVYPLELLNSLRVRATRYAYELEVIVKASWAGMELVECPVSADYDAPTSKMSHFHPVLDFTRATWSHAALLLESLRRRATGSLLAHVRQRQSA